MKRFATAILFVSILAAWTLSAAAQVPSIEVYYDSGFNYQSKQCQGVGVLDTLYVTGKSFGSWISSVQYRIVFGGVALTPISEFMVDGGLQLGQSFGDGIAIAWSVPRNGASEFLIEKILVMWQCGDCTGSWDDGISVQPYMGLGAINAVEFQTFDIIHPSGSSAVACGLVPTEETSWGRIKSLYR